MEEQKNTLSYIMTSLVIGLIVGALISYYYYSPKSYQEGFNAAKALVKKSSLGQFIPEGLNTMIGKVINIKGRLITISVSVNDPFLDQSLSERSVSIASSTKITILQSKDPKVFQKEITLFNKNPNKTLNTPYSLLSKPVDFSKIVVGSMIKVFSSKNILTIKEFTANSIEIQPPLLKNINQK